MKEVLLNLANIYLIGLCKAENIDCSGTHVVKNGRGFTYDLIQDDTQKALVSVTFTKNTQPRYRVWVENKAKGE